MKRCMFVIPTPKINKKYEPSPCAVMRWRKNDLPVLCNGWKAVCLGMDVEIYDVRDFKYPEKGDDKDAE
jgi:hypothetical protein